jgi:hypothetical protein
VTVKMCVSCIVHLNMAPSISWSHVHTTPAPDSECDGHHKICDW